MPEPLRYAGRRRPETPARIGTGRNAGIHRAVSLHSRIVRMQGSTGERMILTSTPRTHASDLFSCPAYRRLGADRNRHRYRARHAERERCTNDCAVILRRQIAGQLIYKGFGDGAILTLLLDKGGDFRDIA